jgi:putative ATPase
MPEGRFHLSQAALYLATCPKSNSTMAFFDALAAVENEQESDVPNHLRDASRDKEGFGHGQGYLYPHAYRDHWVAQQYLPEGLQGKLFYQPSDQGYEQQIQLEVTRRREAQLAAMVEGETDVPPEILTTSPTGRARDAWLQRAIASSGRSLSLLRQKLFELASIQRHHLVLDVNAGSGLLTWEAVRRAPEGGVWALTADPTSGDALRQQAERLPKLERPTILVGHLEELGFLLNLRGEENLRFDRILGRNIFNPPAQKQEPQNGAHKGDAMRQLARLLVQRLLDDGRLCLVQTLPRHGQRLYQLVDWSGLPASLVGKVKAAEEAIYSDELEPLVNWDAADLEMALYDAGLAQVQLHIEREATPRRITLDHLLRWFEEVEPGHARATYSQRLVSGGLSPAERDRVAALYQGQLLDQTVPWHMSNIYVVGHL